jgi:acetyl/propionyl-CoA carboxylase alpha subunit
VDSAVEEGDEVSPYYDPMIAKIIMHGSSRSEAIAKLAGEWKHVCVWPVKTNAGFIGRCLADADFIAGAIDTAFVAAREQALTKPPPPSVAAMSQAALQFHQLYSGASPRRPTKMGAEPWSQSLGFRLNAPTSRRVGLRFHGERVTGDLGLAGEEFSQARSWARDGHAIVVFEQGEAYPFELDDGERAEGEAASGDGAMLAPMPGRIVSVAVQQGGEVKKGDALLVLEAMKMEHTLIAPFDAKVVELKAKAGDQVSEAVLLAKLDKL